MQQVLESTGYTISIVMIIIFFLYLSLTNKQQTTSLTVSAVVAIQFLMSLLEPALLSIEDKYLLRFLWYNSFAFCDIALMLMLFHMHRKLKIPYGTAAKHANLSFMCLAFLQVFCFLERTYTDSQVIMSVYSYAVPAIDLTIMFLLTGIMLKEMFSPQTNASKATNQTH